MFYHPIGKHSVKPEDIQTWLEKSFTGPYLELFSTRERSNWTCLGYNTGWKLTSKGIEKFESDTVGKSGHKRQDPPEVPPV